jgi:hypothetical protein
MFGRLLVVGLTFFPLAARACDLCGYYSPQVESMPEEKNSMIGFYAAVAKQFTHSASSNSTIVRLPILPASAWTVQSPNS